MNTIQIIHEALCTQCPKSTYCHEAVTECEEFYEMLIKASAPTEEEIEKARKIDVENSLL